MLLQTEEEKTDFAKNIAEIRRLAGLLNNSRPLADAASKIFLATRSVIPNAERLASDGWTGAFNHAIDTLKQHAQSNSDGSSTIAEDVIYLRGPQGFASIARWCEGWAEKGAALWRINVALEGLIAGAQPFM
jgi:hypothetical protein